MTVILRRSNDYVCNRQLKLCQEFFYFFYFLYKHPMLLTPAQPKPKPTTSESRQNWFFTPAGRALFLRGFSFHRLLSHCLSVCRLEGEKNNLKNACTENVNAICIGCWLQLSFILFLFFLKQISIGASCWYMLLAWWL